jgi:uncharacterized protein YbjT (DUF2867 family)
MSHVLVTGGTGTFGRALVPRLVTAGHDVRILSRNPNTHHVEGVQVVHGNVRTGVGLSDAADDVETIIHLATSPRWRPTSTELVGTGNVLAAASQRRVHFIYVSIVGADRIRFPYYQAKLRAERQVEAADIGWTIQRTTQFHAGLDQFLGYGAWPVTANMAFQPVDESEVSARIVEFVDGGPAGRVTDFGGPEVLPIRQVLRSRREITGRRALPLRVPAIGVLRDLDNGHQLCPVHARGSRTWEDWLKRQAAAPIP